MMLDTIKKRIIDNKFNFDSVMSKGYYYGKKINITPLFCSYGQIGYVINCDGKQLIYDYELKTFKIK